MQITRTLPLRRMTLHEPQILLTLDFTFMASFLSTGDATRADGGPTTDRSD